MISRQKILTALTVLTLVPFAGLASAASQKSPYASEVESCVAEVSRHANYDQATRVRHTVVIVKETRMRFVFTIDTSVFTDSTETAAREYTTFCVARGDGTPLKFRIKHSSA